MTSVDRTPLAADPVVERGPGAPLRPALLARYLDVAGLRHDAPLVLVDDEADPVRTLTAVVNELLVGLAPPGAEGERLRHHVLRLERAVRRELEQAAEAPTLVQLWETAADALRRAAPDDETLHDSLDRAREALRMDGVVLRCDEHVAVALVRHLRDIVERPREDALHQDLTELQRRLTALLAADDQRSPRGRDPDRLRAAVGSTFEDAFDFDAWSEVLATRPGDTALPGPRRTRVEWALTALRDQRVVPDGRVDGHRYVFDSCAAALAAYQERVAEVARLVKATAIAHLELDNAYDEPSHDPSFHAFDAAMLERDDVAGLPGYLVVLEGELDPTTRAQVLDVLASPLPFTILIVTTDAIGPPPLQDLLSAHRLRGPELASAALGLGTAGVVQTTTSMLAHTWADIRAALARPGPALISVVASVEGDGLPHYLVSAAAAEARAAPIFVYDPDAADDHSSGLDVSHTPQSAADWPAHELAYEDEQLQRVREDVAFTVADLVAADPRYADHVTVVPRAMWNGAMVPVAELLQRDPGSRNGAVPYVLGVGPDDVLRRIVVDHRVVAFAEQRLAAWRRLQRLAGVHDAGAHAGDLPDTGVATADAPIARTIAATPHEAPPPAATDASPETEPEWATDVPSPDEAWIETARCTTCDECTNLNPRMFAYDENKQATIVDLRAGTFRDLVQAAEACQVSIIHPGAPWDPDEPGLDDLRRRAAAFT